MIFKNIQKIINNLIICGENEIFDFVHFRFSLRATFRMFISIFKQKIRNLKLIMTRSIFFFILTFSSILVSAQNHIVPLWKKDFKNGLNSINKATSVKSDRFGNCYVLGTTSLADSTKDILVVKYTTDGSELWHRLFNNKSNGDDFPRAMTLDLYGDVWVCGIAKLSPDKCDFLVTKFSNEGVPQFEYVYDGPDQMYDEANCIAADKLGNVYVGGYTTSSDSGLDLLLMRFYADGSLAWKKKYATLSLDNATSLVVDDSCNVYVCGNTNNSQRSSDIIVMKYDSAGNQQWSQVYDGIFSERDAANIIRIDDSLNVYVSGFVNHTNDRSDLPLLKFSPQGVLLKESLYNGVSADCQATSIRIEDEYAFVTGKKIEYNTATTSGVLLKYNKAGSEKLFLKTPADVFFDATHRFGNREIVFGTKLTHPESTLIPFIAEIDTLPQFKWTFSDSTVYGISHFVDVEVDKDNIYFLGDDAGDATGTINLLKYKINTEAEQKKKPAINKSNKSGIPKNK